jgi:hypothetical protein
MRNWILSTAFCLLLTVHSSICNYNIELWHKMKVFHIALKFWPMEQTLYNNETPMILILSWNVGFCVCIHTHIRGCNQKFPEWVDNEITKINTNWKATQRVMAAKLTRLTHKIVIQLHLLAESCTICSSRSRRPVRKLLDTPAYIRGDYKWCEWLHKFIAKNRSHRL